MSELRQNRATGEWVIIAAERGRRPHQASPVRSDRARPGDYEPGCPFCPGNEAQLPAITAERASRTPPGWQVRVVPNKYPVTGPAQGAKETIAGRRTAKAVHGYHEVVIEHPRHGADPASMTVDELDALISMYRQRYVELSARPGIETVILFRNHGAVGGASLPHPHSQIVALALAPPRQRAIADWMRSSWERTGRCVVCDELESEIADGNRIVEESRFFAALVPFAAAVPSEIWLVPKRHQASFAAIEKDEGADLGRLVRSALRRLNAAHGDPPYNFVVESFECGGRAAPDAHWWLRIAPKLVTWGGFELGAGMPINPSSPEADAALLRGVRMPTGPE